MASFTTQVGYRAGSTSSHTSQITQWLDDAVKEIVDTCIAMRPGAARMFCKKSSSFSVGSPLTITENDRVVDVESVYSGTTRLARRVSLEAAYLAGDTASIHYRTQTDPGWYIQDFKVKLVGEGTTNYAYIVTYGTVTDATPAVAYFPTSLYPQVVRYAAIKLLQAKIDALTETDEDVELAAALGRTLNDLQIEYKEAFAKWGGTV